MIGAGAPQQQLDLLQSTGSGSISKEERGLLFHSTIPLTTVEPFAERLRSAAYDENPAAASVVQVNARHVIAVKGKSCGWRPLMKGNRSSTLFHPYPSSIAVHCVLNHGTQVRQSSLKYERLKQWFLTFTRRPDHHVVFQALSNPIFAQSNRK